MKTGLYFSLLLFFLAGSAIVFSQPLPPENLTALQGSSVLHPVYVKLNWSSPSDMVRFNIYRKDGAVSDTGSFVKRYAGLRSLSFNDMRVLPGGTYSYYVTAINRQGESTPSNVVEITMELNTGSGTVSGVITNDNTMQPVPNAAAVFFYTSGYGMGITASTDSNGIFNATLRPGSYYLKTMARGYYMEFYDNVPVVQEATPILVTDGSSLNFNIGLTPYVPPVVYTLSGSVKDSLENPLPSVLKAYNVRSNTRHHFLYSTRTDSLGNYTLNVREGDTLVVMAVPVNKNYFPEFWDDKFSFAEADRIPVTGDITGINFILQQKPVYLNSVSGVVADLQNIPVESFVTAVRLDSRVMRRYVVTTDLAGVYTFSNLIPGKYILRADPREGYQPTFFKYDGSQTLNWREADSVMVDASSLITGIDFSVVPLPGIGEGTIAGLVSTSAGENLHAAYVYALGYDGEIAGYGITDRSGKYRIDGLNSGEYRLFTDKPDYNFDNPVALTVDYEANIYQRVNLVLNPASVTEVKNSKPEIVTNYQLYQNYPNPFNPVTSIKFSLPEKSNVKMTVYNLLGIQVAELINEVKDAGNHTISFDASDLASGIYFYKLETGKYTQTRKLTLIK
jgi:fibronectin type 3 domain-containing protein